MPRTRTPPPLQPKGWEKCSTHIDIQLTETEHLLWRSVFGYEKMADQIRRLVNVEAYVRAGIPANEIPEEYMKGRPSVPPAVQRELKRHHRTMMKLAEGL